MHTDDMWVLLLRVNAVSTSSVAWLSFLKAITKRWHASVSSVLVNTLWRGSVVLAGTIFIEAMQQI
jgi:hypothetical protein